jgi:hypothetical protein
MLTVLTAGILGGIIGAALVALTVFGRGMSFGRLRAARGTERLTALSYDLWRLYVDLVSGVEVRSDAPRALYQEVLLATSTTESRGGAEGALFTMTSLLFRAWDRAGELRRVGLSVSSGQFADLTEMMQAAFGLVQLEAAGDKRTGAHWGTSGGSVTDLSLARMRMASRMR